MNLLSVAAELYRYSLYIVELAVPGDEVGYAFFNRGGGLVAGGLCQFGAVGVGVGDVAGLQGQQVFLGFFAQGVFYGFNVLDEFNRVVVADVEDAVWSVAGGRVRVVAVPVRVGFGDLVTGAYDAFYDVVYVGEVPCVVAVVEHGNGFAGQGVLGELEQRHVGSAPGAVYGEEAQSGCRQTVQMAVTVCHVLVGEFCGGVELQGVVYAVVLAERHAGVGAVYTAGAGVCQVWCFGVAAGLQDVGEGDDVAFHIAVWIFQ